MLIRQEFLKSFLESREEGDLFRGLQKERMWTEWKSKSWSETEIHVRKKWGTPRERERKRRIKWKTRNTERPRVGHIENQRGTGTYTYTGGEWNPVTPACFVRQEAKQVLLGQGTGMYSELQRQMLFFFFLALSIFALSAIQYFPLPQPQPHSLLPHPQNFWIKASLQNSLMLLVPWQMQKIGPCSESDKVA